MGCPRAGIGGLLVNMQFAPVAGSAAERRRWVLMIAAARTDSGISALYVCPDCSSALADSGERLCCSCGKSYPIVRGMPRFVEDEGYADSFGFQWRRHALSQLDSVNGTTLTRDRFFRGTHWPERMDGEVILEAGCGAGRFTEILLSTGAAVVSFDYSGAAEVARERFGPLGAEVCQASLYAMPYRAESFGRVFCYGVLQHCPDVRGAFMALVKMLKPGGHLAVDVYDSRKRLLNARYRVRWLTRRIPPDRLYRVCSRIVPAYMRLFPALHPWNQLVFPIKDYRGALPGLTREQEIEWSVLDTFDALAPAYDSPQSLRTMLRWCREAGLVGVEAEYGGNGIEVRARRPERRAG